jgi:hypothetical protein
MRLVELITSLPYVALFHRLQIGLSKSLLDRSARYARDAEMMWCGQTGCGASLHMNLSLGTNARVSIHFSGSSNTLIFRHALPWNLLR